MGRKKRYYKRYLIGLDVIQSATLEGMAAGLALSYSEVVGYLMNYYQLGKNEPKVKEC